MSKKSKSASPSELDRWIKNNHIYDPNMMVPICPRCGSINVKDRGMISQRAYSNLHVCTSCGFVSPLFPEMKLKDAVKLKRKKVHFNPQYMPVFADTVQSRQEKPVIISPYFWILLAFFIAWIIYLYIATRV